MRCTKPDFILKKNIELIETCSDSGAGTRGAGFASEALYLMAQKDPGNILNNLLKNTCYIPFRKGFSSDHARNIELIYHICQSISRLVCQRLTNGAFPVLISGDHSCATGTIAGIKMAKPKSRLGVVWIDAHADLHSPFTTPSGNMHGMPLAASINEDNLALSFKKIDRQTRYFWEKFKNIGNISPKILPQDIVYISLRDFEKEEASLIKTHGIKAISTQTIRDCGTPGVVRSILKQLEYCTDIYVSFDTDCLDASVSKGTGLPVQRGLMPDEAGKLTEMLLESPKAVCFEITELNPFLDINDETTSIIYQILVKGIRALSKEKTTEQISYQIQ